MELSRNALTGNGPVGRLTDASLTAQLRTLAGSSRSDRHTAKQVLEAREARSAQLDYLFMGLARELGAEAHIVRVADRTRNFWDRNLRSMSQLTGTLVAVRTPGEPLESATVVDAGSGLPYGEVPWWFTGAHAMVATPKGLVVMTIPPSPAQKNLAETTGEIDFSPTNAALRARWTRSTTGQQGYLERRVLRALSPDDRRRRLEEYCGAGTSFDVERAAATDLDDLSSSLKLRCEAESAERGIGPGGDTYEMDLEGAWIDAVPEFSSRTRALPVVFQFPRSDKQSLDVFSPTGFASKAPPDLVRIDGPYGNYRLSVSSTSFGYHVERAFTLTALKVEPESYGTLREFLLEVRRADRTPLEFARVAGAAR